MAVSKPIIASNVGAHSEIIQDGITGFIVEPNNPVQLAERIEILLANNTLANKMGKCGRERYNKYYTMNKYFKNIEDIYAKLINQCP